MTVVMHFSVVCVICALPFVIKAFTMPGARDILMLAMIALTGCLGLISITIAYRLAPASEISIYDQLGIVMSVLIGWICLGETPSVSTIAGGLIVLTVSSWIFFYNKNKNTNHKE
jgi:drug/metabolite transporter (DMT)-like permease